MVDSAGAGAATAWVADNRKEIVAFAKKFRLGPAYKSDDLVSEAYLAALAAVRTTYGKTGDRFVAAFWEIYRENLGRLAADGRC